MTSSDTTSQGQQPASAVAAGSAVWILVGSYDYSSSHLIACLATKQEADALKQWGEENETKWGSKRYGYDSIHVEEWRIGERQEDVPTLPNIPVSNTDTNT